ncbi:hypothetical protein FA15DRAFT_673638 [Coprinopsis marcescibilis]|uniref:Peptide hydrolase n=1 Tax=Coprinopsis marcescibilis TaxID=230819 RepID=A0A5C3KK27_COPMA|nr:hypothetical protein FA15DRAFT_673638 [Coprinopsis marcescibilis]
MTNTKRWGPVRSLLLLSPVFIGIPLLALWNHTNLPKPITEPFDPVTGLPQISESNILGVAKYLSEDIGYRTVGTKEHALGDAWLFNQVQLFQEECESIVYSTGRQLECEIWRQQGGGSHRFDMMGKRLYKTYVNLTNIIVRISDGTDEGKQHALLVNSHLDSTLPSPGAADDGISVGVMLDSMRVLLHTPDWSPKHAVIFLFNNAEESLQDGSHLYATQHPTASTARAVINLEAAGTTGRELLFQATSDEMINAYSHVPRPYGTVFANDIFSSGILLSDTDFRQFEEYMRIPGLDMAIVGNSYLYHMRKDLVENIEVGVAQHMGENTLALIKHLTSDVSTLPKLADGHSPPQTVYLAYLGGMWMSYSFKTAKVLYTAIFAAAVVFAKMTYVPCPGSRKNEGFWAVQTQGAVAVLTAILCAILVPNLVALLMRFVLGKAMSWFSNPLVPVALYGPAAILGALASQYFSIDTVHEQTLFTSMLLMQTFAALAIQLLGIGSAALFFMNSVPIFIVLLLNPLLSSNPKAREISMGTYFLGQIFPLLTGSLLSIPTLEVFVPLTGRMGADVPSDNLIATLIAVLGAPALPLLLPLSHRFGKRALVRGILLMTIVTSVSIAYFATRQPFDEMHQKRLFVIHMENVTTNEQHLHLAAADGAPGFDLLVEEIVREFGTTEHAPAPVVMNDHNSDWDSLYPFSAFLSPFKVPLAVPPNYVSQWKSSSKFLVSALNETTDLVLGTRSFTIKVDHPGAIWTAIAFDAHVLKWSLDNNPPNEFARHHVKEASFYGTDVYSLDLTIKLTPQNPAGRLKVNFVGLQENGMWPAKKSVKEQGGAAMALFEKLDRWLDEKTGGTVDALLMGCVGGVTVI